ncbi:tellurite resistance TerB family protein [Vibrio mediterranei]
MDLKALLNQALSSDIAKQTTQKASQSSSSLSNALGDKKTLGALGAGAVGGGILGMLMGSKKTKKMGKKALGVGGAAALGALAYKLYNDYSNNNGGNSDVATVTHSSTPADFTQTNQHDESVLKAMIAAAKADGHIDKQEMAKIEQALAGLDADPSVHQLVQTEIAKPLDPSEIAKLAVSPEHSTEIYLASLLVADEQNFMEKAYLKELANQLGLEEGLVAQLNTQIAQ